MASNIKVDFLYMELRDAFPQVNPCILKAVAFENRNDFDAAYRVVVDEVLPFIPEIINFSNLGQKDLASQPMSRAEVAGEQNLTEEAHVIPSCDDVLVSNHAGNLVTPMWELSAKKYIDGVSKINNTDELISFCKGLANHLNVVPEQISDATSIHEDLEGKCISGDSYGGDGYSYSSLMAKELVPLTETNDIPALILHVFEESDANQVSSKGIGSVEALDCDCEPEADSCIAVSEDEQAELIGVSDSELQQYYSVTDCFDSSVPANGVAFLPSQSKKIELLDLSIEEAKTNKKTLFSSMEAVMNNMREVEVREKAAEKAKKEASEGGLEILARAEELKTMLQKKKEVNDMHAGEVYGERSILATEAKELQSRLATLTEERDEALCILDEMRCSLEMRLSVADEEIRKAEKDKLDKENSAEKYFNEQEAIMNKIVQEAKFLQLEAEENSKLWEFLVNRGHTVDTLQGEISVICQDVKSLKCKLDARVPLSESVSSDQTTCILASSSSSKKSISSLVMSDPESPSEPASPFKSLSGLVDDDGWEYLA